MMATNFEAFVLKLAEEAPHAVVLDWFRRLDLMIRDYRKSRGIHLRSKHTSESVIARDPLLGGTVADTIAKLRKVRNDVAHTDVQVSSETAIEYARQCFLLIGVLWKARDAHAA